MKKLNLSLVLLIMLVNASFINSADFKVLDETTVQTIVTIDKSKGIIHTKLKEWILETFDGHKSKITKENEDVIEGIGNHIIQYDSIQTHNMFFDYVFDIKDNKLRVTFKNFHTSFFMPEHGEITYYYSTKVRMKKMIKGINKKNIIENIANHIEGKKKEDQNW